MALGDSRPRSGGPEAWLPPAYLGAWWCYRPSPQEALPMASRLARPPSGIALQHGLWEFSLHPDTHARSLSLLLGSRISRAGCPWGSTFPRRQKVPSSLLEPLTAPLHLPAPGGSRAGGPPTPLLWVCWGPGASCRPDRPPCGGLSPPPPACPVIPLPSSSLSTAFQTLPSAARASNCLGSR